MTDSDAESSEFIDFGLFGHLCNMREGSYCGVVELPDLRDIKK